MATTADAELLARGGEVQGRSLWQDARRRLLRNKAAVVSMVLLALIALGAIFAPWLSPHPFDEIYWDRIGMPPDYANAHWFGTDNLGRDTFSRVMQGTLISLKVGIGAQFVVLIIGILIGASAALTGKVGDNLLMRLTDLAYAFPDLLFIILLRAVLSNRDWPIIGSGDPQIPGFDGVPARTFLVILFLFSIVIGPVSYWFLRRKGQLVLLVLTAPLISLVSIGLLVGYALADDGFRIQGRAMTVTMLDQASRQAATRATVSRTALMRSSDGRAPRT